MDSKFAFTCARGWAFHPDVMVCVPWFSIWSLNSRPPTKLEDGNVFTGVCLFTGGGGYLPPSTYPHLSPTYTPPPKWSKVGGMHPSGMHSCYFSFNTKFPEMLMLASKELTAVAKKLHPMGVNLMTTS